MRLFLILLFPIMEIYLFVQVCEWLNFWWALLGIFLGFFLGSQLLRLVGVKSVGNMMSGFATGQEAASQMGGMMAKVLAAVLFMIPGFISDIIALLLLFPVTRSLLMLLIMKRLMKSGSIQFGAGPFQQRQGPFTETHDVNQGKGQVYEGEATEIKPGQSRIEKDD
jgi:UPF0716 protein FxsA